MPGDVLLALAQFAGQTVAQAAITDMWETARGRFAKLLGRGNVRKAEIAEQWLTTTHDQLSHATGSELEQAQRVQAERWAGRFADLLDEDPGLETELRVLADEVAAQLPTAAVSATDHSVAAGRDLKITADRGATAAGVIHGNVAPLGPGSVAADRGGTAIGKLEYQRRPEVASLPVRLTPRPVFLAGREELLAELNARLARTPGQSGPRVVALCGLGGAGKTSVAIEYAHRHLAEVGVCWQFAAEDPAVLTVEFGVLAAQLGAREVVDPRDPVASVHAVLARAAAGWLVVFDNVPDRAAVEPFVPPAGPGRVLITTQNQHWPPGQALDVPILDPDVAADFLVNRTGDPDRVAAGELAVQLGGLPLALEQAAAYMQATGETLAGCLALFRHRRAEMLARGKPTGYSKTVATTWALAFDRLQRIKPGAVGLLRLLAFCAPEAIPLRLLLQPRPGLAERLSPEVAPVLVPLLEDRLAAGDAIEALGRYSLVTLAGDGLASMHRLVQAATADQLTAELARGWRQAAAAVIEAAIPDDPRQAVNWPNYAALLPHAKAALADDSDGMARIANYLGTSGSYAAARDLWRRVLYARDRVLGPEHPHTLITRRNIAFWTGDAAGDPAAARDLLTELLPAFERVLGPEHPETLWARGNLAFWTGEAGDPAAARDLFIELLAVRDRVLGPKHPHTVMARVAVARWTGEAGDPAAARDLAAEALPVFEQISGPEHRDTLVARHHVARWTGEAGDPAAARDLVTEVLPVFERALGPEHPDTLTAHHSLAFWTGEAGDPAAARDLLTELLPVFERVLGPEHPDTLLTRHDVARWTGMRRGTRPPPGICSLSYCPCSTGSSAPSTRAP